MTGVELQDHMVTFVFPRVRFKFIFNGVNVFFSFLAAVTIYSDFGDTPPKKKLKSLTVSIFPNLSVIYSPFISTILEFPYWSEWPSSKRL